jgi:hypothetical protein
MIFSGAGTASRPRRIRDGVVAKTRALSLSPRLNLVASGFESTSDASLLLGQDLLLKAGSHFGLMRDAPHSFSH